ncbi:DUF1819 family protein [Bifidobacterium boum]|jgi:hypothetical protein|uniref:DUF1819 family protein n=1 Tax=Bifidobacterium boum TaxID=78343 RepID=UPI001F33C4E5|nr:DUF1819 family protein [Bifidobacterium boum]MCF2561551.1 DUF1819 family protein [Bifidobacterium boum]
MNAYGTQRMLEGERYRLSFTVGGLLALQGRTIAELFFATSDQASFESEESAESNESTEPNTTPEPTAEVGKAICRVRDRAVEGNVLAIRTRAANKRVVSEVLKRLSALTFQELKYLAGNEASYEERTALMWVAMCRYYALVGEFASEVVVKHFWEGNLTLSHSDYDRYIALKATWHPELDEISEATNKKLRGNLFKAMGEAGILDSRSGEIVPYLMNSTMRKLLSARPQSFTYFPLQDRRGAEY